MPSKRAIRDSAARGFTLLEVVVALVIFALVFGALAQIIATGFRQSLAAGEVIETTLLAESMLARIGNEFALEPGRFGGEAAEGHSFLAVIEPVGAPIPDLGMVRYRIELVVFPEGEPPERGVRIATIRVGAAAP